MSTDSSVTSSTGITEEQKFLFDLKGWLLLPGVLSAEKVAEIRDHLAYCRAHRSEVPFAERYSLTGPAQMLVDHPAILGILREIIAPDISECAYGFRCESSFCVHRNIGEVGAEPPHRGPSIGPLSYQVVNGRIWSGLTRVVWELTDVNQRLGGTCIMSGSHKSSYQVPAAYRQYEPTMYESYSCPAGSAIVFTECCWHYGMEWKDPLNARVAILNGYNSVVCQYHKMDLPEGLVESMPPKRQTLFRGVWGEKYRGSYAINDYYRWDNKAL